MLKSLYSLEYSMSPDMKILVHFMVLSQGVELLRKYIPKNFTFADAFCFMAVSSHYLVFYMESLEFKWSGLDSFLVGGNNHNLVIFVPVRDPLT